MKGIFRRLVVLVTLLLGVTQATMSEGILIFEISDAQNRPVSDLSVNVESGGVLYKTYTTDESGRVVDPLFPAGDYTYSFDFGDLRNGSFSVANGSYTWINLDYRLWTISFMNEDGSMLEGKKATIYKVNDDKSETLIAEKVSDSTGVTEFLVPEGQYKYSTFRGSNYVTVKDQNINTEVSVASGEITHQTHFCFINDKGTHLTVFAKDIFVTHLAPDSVYPFGAVDAHSDVISGGYYQYNTTDNYVSCPAGTYSCSVQTKDYGTIVDTFIVDDNDVLEGNIVYLVLPTLPDTSGGSQGSESRFKIPINEEVEGEHPVVLEVRVRSILDSLPLPLVRCNLMLTSDNSAESPHTLTDDSGKVSWLVAPDVYDVVALRDTMRGINVERDTSVTIYINPDDYTKVYFDFYYGKEMFVPSSVKKIMIWPSDDQDAYVEYFGRWRDTIHYLYEKPVLMSEGVYRDLLNIDEKGYHTNLSNVFMVGPGDTALHVKTELLPFHKLNIELTDVNHGKFESRQYVIMETNGFISKLVTDSAGHYSGDYTEGTYILTAFEDTQVVNLLADTTIYFQSKAPLTQKVKFQFLHDGQVVYPQIMNMDVYKRNPDALYSKSISKFYDDYEGKGAAWVFEEYTVCEVADYYVKYVLKDYDYNGTFSYDFNVSGKGGEDTTVYIVVPVKRSVSITIKDANLDLVNGVFGNIYKYDENGELMSALEYDYDNHEGLRTNSEGVIIDHLVPGRYQLRILDIKRDFIVKDYDLEFDIISGTKMYDVKYKVLYKSSKKYVPDLLLDVNKDGMFYNSSYTDETGTVELFCEAGKYSYYLHYGTDNDGSYQLTGDTTIYIYIEDPIYVDSISIQGCACLTHGDTLQMSVSLFPGNPTQKEIEWSSDNDVVAHITSEGVLITHDVKTDGFVTVTAKSLDAKGTVATRTFFVGNGNCGSPIKLNFEGTSVRELPISSNKQRVVVSTDDEDKFPKVYLYQTSSDSVKWTSILGPTTESDVLIPTDGFDGDMLLRVLVSTSESDLKAFEASDTISCGTDRISDVLMFRMNKLLPIGWPDSICATQKEVVLSVDKRKLGTIPEGYTLQWYVVDGDKMVDLNMTGSDSITVSIDSTTTYKTVIGKDDDVVSEYHQTIFVETVPSFHLKVDRDTICLFDTLSLSVVMENGAASRYLWSCSDENVQMLTHIASDSVYTVTVESEYRLCPSQSDTVRVVLDAPIDFTLLVDKSVICETDTAGIVLSVDSSRTPELDNGLFGDMTDAALNSGLYSSDTPWYVLGGAEWSNGEKGYTLRDMPSQSTTYSVTATSRWNACKSVTKDISVEVRTALSVSLSLDAESICQRGDDSIHAEASVLTGEAKKYVWWDGLETDTTARTVFLGESDTLWVMVVDSVCENSLSESLPVQVARPATVSLSSPNKIFEYGTGIDLVATTTGPVFGPYRWYAVDASGEENVLSVSDDSSYTDLPNGNVTYSVIVENGECGEIGSNSIRVALVDNIVIPTVFTPHNVDGENDDFMPGYPVTIYDRYGDVVCNSNSGWDGYYKGKLADPGVYIYVLTLKDDRVVKGTIEIFKKK
ncbi:MAG: gliding motility-associated C-terminal domain-containing protein [Paludibacteraceae bacterium]|nr:gliding motility-associated C-terminal domain-containing protein [Paludibacteraceae bacterium]